VSFALCLMAVICDLPCGLAGQASSAPLPHVLIATEKGNVVVEIDTVRAPVTGANFLRYVDARLYAAGTFHRTVTAQNQPNDSVRIAVIQGSVKPGQRSFPPIPLEPTSKTGLTHKDGTLAMVRGAANTASSAFFICIGDQPGMDAGGHRNEDGLGFAAFGRVISGMDVVRRIHATPDSAGSQKLVPPIRIDSIVRTKR
jgi:peptidyl-prolyl cis-trans isomerase A (cyclophilin A)